MRCSGPNLRHSACVTVQSWVVDALLTAALPKQDQSRVEPRLLLGTRSAQYGGIFVVNTHPVEDFKAAKPTLHIIIPTTGTINQPLQ